MRTATSLPEQLLIQADDMIHHLQTLARIDDFEPAKYTIYAYCRALGSITHTFRENQSEERPSGTCFHG